MLTEPGKRLGTVHVQPDFMAGWTGGRRSCCIRSNINLASEAWQIGSKKPPTVCLCCGSLFDDDKHRILGPYDTGPYRYVCEWCWKKSYMFFPDKISREGSRESAVVEVEILANAPVVELE